jgi:hypothetical protein
VKAQYIPGPDGLANAWLVAFAATIAAAQADYKVTLAESTQIGVVTAAFNVALETATNPNTRTKATVAAKDQARATAELYVRPIATRISADPTISAELKTLAGVTLRNNGGTPVPAPVIAPQLGVRGIIPGMATIEATNPDNSKKTKPEGVVGIEIAAVIGTAFTADPSAAVPQGTWTRGLISLPLAQSASGQKISLFARYATRTGPNGQAQTGPWSAPLQFHGA